MIQAQYIDRECINVRSSGDSRQRVDAYFVSFACPSDAVNKEPELHSWFCRFEVPRGAQFVMSNFKDKEEARASCGYTHEGSTT